MVGSFLYFIYNRTSHQLNWQVTGEKSMDDRKEITNSYLPSVSVQASTAGGILSISLTNRQVR
jgi:hypothetical protein